MLARILIGTDAESIVNGAYTLKLDREPLLVWPEIDATHHALLPPQQIVENLLAAVTSKDDLVILTMSEIVVVFFRSLIRNEHIQPDAVEFYWASKDGCVREPHTITGNFALDSGWYMQYEIDLHLRFSDPTSDLAGYEAFKTKMLGANHGVK